MTDMKPKVIITRDLGPRIMSMFDNENLNVIVWTEDSTCDQDWLEEHIKGAVGLIVIGGNKVDANLLDLAGPSLKVVSTMSVGYDHVELDALRLRKIPLGYTPDVLTEAVADITVMLALMAGRNVREAFPIVLDGQWSQYPWSPYSFCGPQLSPSSSVPSRTVGFLGFGRIAQATLKRLVAFGVTDCLYTPNPSSSTSYIERDIQIRESLSLKSLNRVDLDDLAKQSDILFVLAPGGSKTYHLINERVLGLMKTTSLLINASRGTLVDSDALAKALQEGKIWGAGLDVVEGEPMIHSNHPLLSEKRCVILPHIGSATNETRRDMAVLCVENALAGIRGKELPASVKL